MTPKVAKHYYQHLGIHRDASEKEIKQAYRELAREAHPDHGGNVDAFNELSEAYKTIVTPQLKTLYDKTLDKKHEKCWKCKGTGYKAKQVSFTHREKLICETCRGAGVVV